MKNRKIVFAFAILMTNALFAQKTHFQMSSLRPDADSAFSCRVTAKYDNGRFVQYTGCTIFPYTSTKNAKVRLSFDADEVPRFLEFLERVRDKYAEWSNTATTNHVRGFSKKMPIEMKSKGGIWSLYYVDGKPPRSTFDMNRQWEFLIPLTTKGDASWSGVQAIWNTMSKEAFTDLGTLLKWKDVMVASSFLPQYKSFSR